MEKNKTLMRTTKRHQFELENKAWERSLEFFNQENALLKYRLSEIVDYNEEEDLLSMAEYFQNEFISKDEQVNKLIKVIRQFSDKLYEIQSEEKLSGKMIRKQDKLRNEILEFEKNFLQLSMEFNARMLKTV